MIKMQRPEENARSSFLKCVSGVKDTYLKARLELCSDVIDDYEKEYISYGNSLTFVSINPLVYKKGENPIVTRGITKDELIWLYENRLVKSSKCRPIYDQIKVLAKGRCPYCCGIGHVSTLDHYLPKTTYPQFSVFPVNLVPSCQDCNFQKRSMLAETIDKQTLHPYFDSQIFFNEQWISARVEKTEPCSIIFEVDAPLTWRCVDKSRVLNHFKDFNIARRYGIKAAEELTVLVHARKFGPTKTFSPKVFSDHLASYYKSPNLLSNNWRKVMYKALSEDSWFCHQSWT